MPLSHAIANNEANSSEKMPIGRRGTRSPNTTGSAATSIDAAPMTSAGIAHANAAM